MPKKSHEQHQTVGRHFKFSGDVYFCFRYERRQGFWMRLVERGEGSQLIPRVVGDETCVSERAPGATYHRVRIGPLADSYSAHEPPCECYVCQPES